MISIHAPLAGRDISLGISGGAGIHFNPRAPRGARQIKAETGCSHIIFQSTRPSRGATSTEYTLWPRASFQSTRPSRGATPPLETSPRRRGTFQSTRPSRGATGSCGAYNHVTTISIHAPLAGRDHVGAVDKLRLLVFQSTRPSRGATTLPMSSARSTVYFNPRAPRGARQYT